MRAIVRYVLLTVIFLAGFTAKADSAGYKIYSDYAGNIYLEAPKKFVLIHGEVSIPLSLIPINGLLKLVQGANGWSLEVLTEAQWKALQLTEGHSAVSGLTYADVDGDGRPDITITFDVASLPALIVKDLTTSPVLQQTGVSVPYDPVDPVLHQPPVLATLVGMSAGEFRVDESGAANYQLPLAIPAGIAGVQPALAFNYNSSAGDGYMGMGWQFSGASAVSRCPKNIAVDNVQGNISFSASDRLCLDGQRLVTKGRANDISVSDSAYWSATEYHTELESFGIVRQHGSAAQGPLAFSVETKSGEIHYYGDISAVSGNDSMGQPLALSLKRYGGSAETGSDAFFETAASSNKARLWALKAIKDVKGNYIAFRYAKDVSIGEHYLAEVHYTGRAGGAAPFARVILKYENNTKISVGWHAGSRVAMTKLLTSVDIYQDAALFRHYRLNYFNTNVLEEKNYLESIQECSDSNAKSCLPATVFEWERPAAEITMGYTTECNSTYDALNYCWQASIGKGFAPFSTSSALKGASNERQYQQIIDINGDGYADMVYPRSGSWRVRFGGTANYATESTLTALGVNKKEYAQTIDYNGDGQRDLLIADSATKNWHTLAYIPSTSQSVQCEPNGGGTKLCVPVTVTSRYTLIDTQRNAFGLEGQAFVADINGDGLEDIVYLRNNRFKMYRNLGKLVNGSYFSTEEDLGPIGGSDATGIDINTVAFTADMKSASMIDINGDGKTDILLRVTESRCSGGNFDQQECAAEKFQWTPRTRLKLFVSTGAQLVSDANGMIDYSDVRAVDLNGDGYTDILYRANNIWHYRLSDGSVFQAARSTGLSVADNLKHLTYFLDLNGDGRTDILLPTSTSNWHIYLSRPSTNTEQVVFERRGTRAFDANATIQFADINADGKLDLLTSTNDSGWKTFLGAKPNIKDHVIKNITNGWGVKTSIAYKNITDSNVYFRQSSSNNISSDYFSPRAGLYVVSNVSTQTTGTNSVGVDYQYGGLLLHKKGRGLLGFEVLRTTDKQTDVVTETVYHQEWPYTGIPKSTSQAKGTVQLSFAQNNVNVIDSAYGGKFPYIQSTEEFSYQQGSDGLEYGLAKTSSTFTYDSYGNLTASTLIQSDIANNAERLVTTTVNDYGTSVIYKRYGRLTSSSVRKQLYESNSLKSDISRSSAFSYYPADLMLETETLSPGDAKTKTTTRYSYDVAGNTTAKAVTAGTNASGSATATRTNRTVYDNRFRYVKQSIDITGHSTDFTYNSMPADTVTGIIRYINATDSNGQTSRQYFDVLGRQYHAYQKGKGDNDPVINSYSYQYYCGSSCDISGAYVRITQVTDGQAEQQQFLDKFGRAIASKTQLSDGTWSVSTTTYDSQGRPDKTYEPGKGAASTLFSQAHYDNLGRVYSTSLASGGTSSIEYQGLTVVETDPNNKTKRTTNNYLGQSKQVEDHSGNKLLYSYDAFGNLDTVTAVSGNISSVRTKNMYDAYGRKYQMTDQDKGIWSYVYNAFGELLSQTNANNQVTTFNYDAIGRQNRRQDPSGTTCWEYGSSAVSYNLNKLVRVRSFDSNVACDTAVTPAYEEIYSYNSRGLASGKLVRTAGSSFRISSTYDSYNRLNLLTYPSWSLNPADDVVIKHHYDNGALTKLIDNQTNRVYQQVSAINARGQATKVTYANGVTEDRAFYAHSGWLDTLTVKRGSTHVHNMDYNYDYVGNVSQRQLDFGSVGSQAGFTEVFGYDDLHRVTSRTISAVSGSSGYNSLPAALKMNESYRYDNFGNMTFKTNVGNYCYDNSKTNRLLAVGTTTSCTGTGAYTFGYDNNGNVTLDGKRSFTYTAFDKPSRVTQGANRTDFAYGPDRQMFRRIDVRDNKTTDTLYIDGAYERANLPTGVTEHKFYVGNAVITKRSNNAHDEYYLHKDGQGSTTSITNASGALLQQFIYDPWGKQYSVNTNSVFNTYSNPGTSKGYTGHNMVNDFEVIHMGGRIYNPILGRFMQADPFIQAPSNLQNYNRYSYVLNNPMSYTDPSGYFFKSIGKFVKKYWRVIAAAVVTYVTAGAASGWAASWGFAAGTMGNAVVAGAMTGVIGGAIATGNLRGALAGALTGAVFGAIGHQIHGAEGTANAWSTGEQMLAHGIAGGVMSSLQGGQFGHGFISAGIMKGVGKIQTSASLGRTLIQAIAGGTVSKLTGGKFANGAVTSAMQYTVNELMPELAAKANKMFSRAKFDDMVSTNAQVGIDLPTGTSVSTDGENGAMGQSININAKVVDITVGGECSFSGSCSGELGVAKSLTFIDENLASVQVKAALNTDGNLSGSLQGKIMGKNVQGTVTLHGTAVSGNGATLINITEQSLIKATTNKFLQKAGGF
ncbi:toxin TcdB middle/N-terminal domain-containing protein [Rheinheimera pacifica]|uniref:toxin TcdB middle/N-terminal domain-containing protein n=1 Tax=Rheinheimera pacifica TaxID=173990 RepID=UPI002EDA93CD